MSILKEKHSVGNSTHYCLESKGKSCSSSRVMAFVIPFSVITVSSVACHNHSMIIATTLGFLAGTFGFGLYGAMKATLRKVRTANSFQYEQIKIAER